jgi:hypothetical protein
MLSLGGPRRGEGGFDTLKKRAPLDNTAPEVTATEGWPVLKHSDYHRVTDSAPWTQIDLWSGLTRSGDFSKAGVLCRTWSPDVQIAYQLSLLVSP